MPLYVTEFGWTTMPAGTVDYAPESKRPGYVQATIPALGHTDCGVAAVLLYTWVTPERDPANGQDWYGIASPNGGSTPDLTRVCGGPARRSHVADLDRAVPAALSPTGSGGRLGAAPGVARLAGAVFEREHAPAEGAQRGLGDDLRERRQADQAGE